MYRIKSNIKLNEHDDEEIKNKVIERIKISKKYIMINKERNKMNKKCQKQQK